MNCEDIKKYKTLDSCLFVALPVAWLVVSEVDTGHYVSTHGCQLTKTLSNHVFTPLLFVVLFLCREPKQALGLLAAMFMQTGIVTVIKHHTEVRRPNGDLKSFPSGHTASAATVSYYALLALLPRCRKNPGLGLLLLTLTLMYAWWAGCCRINEGMHFPVDVVGSHVIAFVLSYSIIKLSSDVENKRSGYEQHENAVDAGGSVVKGVVATSSSTQTLFW